MHMPQLTPQRQKTLMGVAAAGLLLLLGFSFAPSLEVAGDAEVDEVLAIVEDDRTLPTYPVEEEAPVEPRPFRRARLRAVNERDEKPAVAESPAERAVEATVAQKEPNPKPLQTIPPSYQQRLELLAEEEALLQRRRQAPVTAPEVEPAASLTAAFVDSEEADSGDVEHAFAVARRPERWRRVELLQGTQSAEARSTEPRGAWLSGNIELD